MKRADSLLASVIKDLGIADGVKFAEIKRDWNSLFDRPLSFHMSPSMFSNGELLIFVDSPAWLQELSFFREEICRKLAPYAVKSVRFRLGRIPANTKKTVRNRKTSIKHLSSAEHEIVKEMVSGIDDEGLKWTMKNTIEKAIASGKTKVD
ncbi:MAG: DUF721 domain-containing protein [Nitrospira sp.]|nr:DUF721 domain-containing protein [Nitrospira sp.]